MPDYVAFASTVTDPYERGVEYGAVHAPQVAATVAAYQRLWTFLAPDVDLPSVGALALASINEQAPRAADEIAGLAAGSGRTVEEIASLNARTEVLGLIAPRLPATECSTVVATGPGHPPVATQTWDWYPHMQDNWMVWTFPTAAGGRVTTLTEYGVLAKIGVNDAGLGVMLNMLHHDADDQSGPPRIGFPVHVLLRTLLERCSTVEGARELTRSRRFTASSAVTVVDRGGDAASLETFPEGVGEVAPEEGLLVRTNHFVSAEGAPGCQGGLLDDNSWVRRDHLLATLGASPPDVPADVLAAMTHHLDAGPICRHAEDPDGAEYLEVSTLATATLDVEHGRLAVLRGGPCQGSSAQVRLPRLAW